MIRKKIIDLLKEEFFNDLVLELSKYYNEIDDMKEIKDITSSYFWDSFKYNSNYSRKIYKVFLVDNDYAIALSYEYYAPYDSFKIDAHKAYNNLNDGRFVVYKKSFFTFSIEDDLESAVKEFSEMFNKSIRAGQKKKELSNNINKYNL